MKMQFNSDTARWAAIEQRDRHANNHFYYGVKSTGVYCRPSCSSRKPKRENVEFFLSAIDAQHAGYRACKKCTPNSIPNEILIINQIRNLLDSNAEKPLTLIDLSKKINLSPFHLQRLFKRETGMTPKQYQELHRIHRFKSEIKQGKKLTEAIYNSGFESNSNAYNQLNKHLGMRPSTYQKKGEGIIINFTVFPTSLGKILIAATSIGMCRIDIGNNTNDLIEKLKTEFLNAKFLRDQKKFSIYENKIKNYLSGNLKNFDFPLDMQGTIFQKKVWAILCTIPYGETRTYTQIAEAMDAPLSVRAVAGAIAKNDIALVVPCHRVIGKNGKLSGYRWGQQKKEFLLNKESKPLTKK